MFSLFVLFIILLYPISSFSEVPSHPTAMESSLDGKYLYIGDLEGNFYQWDIDARKILIKRKVHTDKITTILPSIDKSIIFTASFDKLISILNLNDSEIVKYLRGHNAPVTSLSFNHDHNLLISGSSDMTVKAWDIKTTNNIKTYDKFNSVITAVTTVGDNIFAGTSEGYVYMLSLLDDAIFNKINLHEGVVSSLSVITEKGYLLSSSWDRSIAIWDINNKSLLKRCRGHEYWVSYVFRMKDKILSAGSLDYTLRVWNLDDCKEILKIKDLGSYVIKGIFSRDMRYIFSLTLNEGIKQWDALTGELILSPSLEK